METNLRQAFNQIEVFGTVAEKDLKEEFNKELNCNQINGYITIKLDDTNLVRLSVQDNEKTKSGADSKTYAGIKTVMNDYRSIAEVGEEFATKTYARGELNPYYSYQTNQDTLNYKGKFFNSKNIAETEPRAEFDVEIFVSGISPEVDKDGEETGRMKVKGWLPRYNNGIDPVEFIVPDDIADAFCDNCPPGSTVRLQGDVVNNRIVEKKEIPMAIGKPKVETKTTYKNELVITGCSYPYEEDSKTTPAPYNQDTIKAAIQERKDRIESRKMMNAAKAAGAKVSEKPSGAARGRSLDLSGLGF